MMKSFLNDQFFNPLAQDEKNNLIQNASIITLNDNELFIMKGSSLYTVYYILKGGVKLKTEKGLLFNILGQGDFIGLRYLFNHDPVIFSAYGIDKTQVVQIDKEVIKKLVYTNNHFLENIYNTSNVNIDSHIIYALKIKDHKISGALAAFLIYYKDKSCLNGLTHKEIGEIIGYSREGVCKCLNDFELQGYIKKAPNGKIMSLDVKSLKRIQKFA